MDLTKREDLWALREEAQKYADEKEAAASWRRVYQRLADAVNELDAYIARSTLPLQQK